MSDNFIDGATEFFDWLAGRAAVEAEEDGEDWGEERGLISALLDRRELLGRITELETIRDDAIGWAERSDERVRLLEGELLGRTRELERMASQRRQGPLKAARSVARDLRGRARGR